MAEIANQGEELLAQIAAGRPAPGTGRFWWLGQHSFVVRLGGATAYIDPYLEPNPARQTPPLFEPQQVTSADLVLVTHHHGDHLDPYALRGIAGASRHAYFIAPRPHRQRMLDAGVPPDRLSLLSDGETLSLAGVEVTAVRAKHEFFDEGPEGFPYLGYILSGEGVRCYHAGDTLVYDGLAAGLSRERLDAAFLPINGRDAARYRSGCIGNMTYQEAVDLAGELRVGLAVPAHWDMFVGNQEDPAKFLDYLAAKFPDVPGWSGLPGEGGVFPARRER